jgi:hypothetical protein
MPVTQALNAIEPLLVPAPKEDIAKIIAVLDALPRKSEGEDLAKIKVAVYQKALASIPKWALNRAVNEIIRSDHWFPVPARIIEAAEVHLRKVRRRRAVLTAWLNVLKKQLRDESGDRIKPGEVEEDNRIMRSLKLKTRYTPDGAAYQIADGVEDPAPAEPEPVEQA